MYYVLDALCLVTAPGKKVKYTRYFYCNMLRRHFPPFDVTSRVPHIDRNYVDLFYILLFLFACIMFSTTPWLTLRKNTSYTLYSHVHSFDYHKLSAIHNI